LGEKRTFFSKGMTGKPEEKTLRPERGAPAETPHMILRKRLSVVEKVASTTKEEKGLSTTYIYALARTRGTSGEIALPQGEHQHNGGHFV